MARKNSNHDLIINSAGDANNPSLRINNASSSTYNHSIESFNSNLTSGETELILVGKEGSTKNSGYIGYYWSAAGSDDNYITIGHWSANHLLRVHGSGSVVATTNMQAPIFYDQAATAYYIDPGNTGNAINVAGEYTASVDHGNAGFIQTWRNTNTGTSSYVEHVIGNGAASELRIGHAPNYSSSDWNASWVYAVGKPLFLKSSSGNVVIYAGGAGASSEVAIFDTTLKTTFKGSVNSSIGFKSPNQRTNYAAHRWVAGNTFPQAAAFDGTFSANGSSSENTLAYKEIPSGGRGLVWVAENNDSTSNADGGWNKDISNLSDDKAYISIVYVKRASSSTNGTFYHGCHGSHTLGLNGSANTNPYFTHFGIGTLPQDVWCVSIGIIQANNDSNTNSWNTLDGVYRLDTGVRIIDSTTFKMKDGSTTQRHRTYLYYSTDSNAELHWYEPGFYEINGQEPSLNEILNRDDNIIGVKGITALGNTTRVRNIVTGDGTPDTTPAGTAFSNTIKSYGNNDRVVNFEGHGNSVSTWYTSGNTALGAIDQSSSRMSFWQNHGSGWANQFNIYKGYQESSNQLRAPIYYDSADTTYYLDPASTSTGLKTAGEVEVKSLRLLNGFTLVQGGSNYARLGSWLDVSNIGLYSSHGSGNGAHIYPNASSDYGSWRIDGSKGSYNGITFSGTGSTFNTLMSQANGGSMGLFNDTDNEWYFEATRNGMAGMYYNGTRRLETTNAGSKSTGRHEATTDMRAPIFYDSADTTYYADLAATSSNSTSVSLKVRQTAVIGDSSTYNQNDGGWGARLVVSDNIHSRIDVAQDADTMRASWYAHTGHAGSYIGTVTDHHFYMMANNTVGMTLNSTGFAQAAGSMRAPLFYDSADTNYYCDPNGQSRLSTLNLGSSPTSGVTGGYIAQIRGSMHMTNSSIDYVNQLHFYDGVRFFDTGADNYLAFKWGDANYGGIRFQNGGDTIKGYVYGDNGGFGLLDNDGNWALRTQTGTNPLQLRCNDNNEFEVHTDHTLSVGSSRAPIFYDSDDTNYYVNPATGSVLGGTVTIHNDADSAVSIQNGGTNAVSILAHAGDELYLGSNNASKIRIHSGGAVESYGDYRAPIFYDTGDTSFYVDPNATTSGYFNGELRTQNGNYVQDFDYRMYAGGGSYYSSGNSGWTRVAEVTFNANCQAYYLAGKMWNRNYHEAASYDINIVARSECDFTSNNESHFLEFAVSLNGSQFTNYQNRIKAVLIGTGTNSRTYEIQFHESAWNENWWQLWTAGGFTILREPAAPTSAVTGTARLNHVSKLSSDSLYANTDVRAPVYYDSSGTTYYLDLAATGDSLRVAGDVVAFYSSDKRLKDNIKPIDNALSKVCSLSGNTFEWKEISHKETGKSDIGVVAQEVEEVFPEIVNTRDNGYKAVDYQKLSAVLIEAVKELKEEIDELKKQIK